MFYYIIINIFLVFFTALHRLEPQSLFFKYRLIKARDTDDTNFVHFDSFLALTSPRILRRAIFTLCVAHIAATESDS